MVATLPSVQPSVRQSAVQSLIHVGHPKKVIVVGDSLVYGYGDSEGGGWVERLRRGCLDPQQSGPVFYNLGIRGDGVARVTQRLEREFCNRGELRHRTPDLLILSVGINDSARTGRAKGRLMSSPVDFAQSLEQLLIQSRQLCPVLFVGMVPVNEAAMPFADVLYFSRTDQQHYNQITRQLCEAHQIPYLDLFEQWSQESEAWIRDRLCSDGIHPNSLGYRTILETVKAWNPFSQAIR
ncbi:GDSL-like lipase/acylhydrolase, putative [Synechococcus sp. PCC 7335]|uniref:GDSL-type esterase/lipase family protein n=1 Tax=Synechococcus sp. (strain ATCC 29403 / PCC 7335) TaxID=91464 RepID=UPI00017EB881|nr:GDSL-type esterase/lipase family protein [Synechococcus sp. PCC 7335]EDX84433.1 GDSL-like lipase/acylhydrolase, putative [Synechococcus sp. PCC 7335]